MREERMLMQVEDFSYRYPEAQKEALKGVNLNFRRGETVLLTGATGSGKSTLLRALGGFIHHKMRGERRGRIFWKEEELGDLSFSEITKWIALVFQDPESQLFHHFVEDEVFFGLENRGISREEGRHRVDRILRVMGLGGYHRRRVEELSGGEKQRLVLASILVMRPHVLLLDEPTSQLDPEGRRAFGNFLNIWKQEHPEALLLISSHRLRDWVGMADRIVILEEGKVVRDEKIPFIFEELDIFHRLGLEIPLTVGWKRQKEAISGSILSEEGGEISWEEVEDFLYEFRGKAPRFSHRSEMLLEAKELFFRYERRGEWILQDVSFKLSKGEIVAVMGANGSGKSTLLSLIAGLHRPERGELLFRDRRLRGIHEEIGLLLQEFSLMLQAATVEEELDFAPLQRGFTKEERKERREALANALDLENFLEQVPFALSGGEQQRVAVGALLTVPVKLLLLDEPTKGLDWHHIAVLFRFIVEALSRNGGALLFTTHDPEFALWIADRLFLMDRGKLIAQGRPREIFERYREMLPIFERREC